jgi:hypothetical protein
LAGLPSTEASQTHLPLLHPYRVDVVATTIIETQNGKYTVCCGGSGNCYKSFS